MAKPTPPTAAPNPPTPIRRQNRYMNRPPRNRCTHVEATYACGRRSDPEDRVKRIERGRLPGAIQRVSAERVGSTAAARRPQRPPLEQLPCVILAKHVADQAVAWTGSSVVGTVAEKVIAAGARFPPIDGDNQTVGSSARNSAKLANSNQIQCGAILYSPFQTAGGRQPSRCQPQPANTVPRSSRREKPLYKGPAIMPLVRAPAAL